MTLRACEARWPPWLWLPPLWLPPLWPPPLRASTGSLAKRPARTTISANVALAGFMLAFLRA
jgi:hypothetical protein